MISRLLPSLIWTFSLTLTLLLGRSAVLNPSVAFIFTLILLGAGLFWLWQLRRSGGDAAGTPFDLGFFLITLAFVITSHFSIDPVRSYRLAWSWLACLCGFYILLTMFRAGANTDHFLTILSIILFLFVIFGYLELLPQLQNGQPIDRLVGLTGSANILGILLALGSLIQTERLLSRHALWPMAVFWLVLALPIFFFTRSRGAILALMAGITILILVRLVDFTRRDFSTRQILLTVGSLVILGAAALLLIQFLRPGGLLGATGEVRLTLWQTAVENWLERPLIGTGLDTEGTANLLRNQPVFNSLFLRAAHSLWLTILSGTGLLGASAVLWAIWQGIQAAWERRTDWRTQALPLAALIGLLVHATLDTPEPWILFLAACFLATFPWPRSTGKSWLKYFPVGLWLILVAVGVFAYQTSRHYQNGLAAAADGEWPTAAESFDRALRVGPYQDSAALLASGLAHSVNGQSTTAVERFEQLIEQEPGWPGHYVNLGMLYQQTGRAEKARQMLELAQSLAPNNEIIQLNQALLDGLPPVFPTATQRHPFWEAAAAGDWPAAQKLRETLPPQQPLADGLLALMNSDRETAAAFFAEAVAFERSLDSQLWQMWLINADLPPAEFEELTREKIGQRTLVGISPELAGIYPQTILSRAGLEIDLVPQVTCFASFPTIDLHLAILDDWTAQNGNPDQTSWVKKWQQGSHPTYPGLTPCSPSVNR
ncbi:MAG: O-antigen ligase family protein [Ardenticatenaceae bacterium]|nr:O-antigen ligase family protein [Ardenticatenaceae bacterium]